MDTLKSAAAAVLLAGFLGVFIYVMVKSIMDWSKTKSVSVTDVKAWVAKKNMLAAPNDKKSRSTAYYVSFDIDGGGSVSLRVTPKEYEGFAIGSCGRLFYRGDRFLSFEVKE